MRGAGRGRCSLSSTIMLTGMGTELQCSPNFFTTLPRSHGNTVTICFDAPDTRPSSSKDRPQKETTRAVSAPDPVQQPMERIQCHKESLRNTMLEHEKIFKEQVRELHRLYRTQKLLMSQMQNREAKLHPLAYPSRAATARPGAGLQSSASSDPPASSSPSTSNRHGHNAQSKSERSSHLGPSWTKPSLSSRELTICCSQENPRAAQSDGFEHRQPPAAGPPTDQARDHKPGIGTPSSCSDDECDLDLTLSIGCGGSKKRTTTGRRSHSETPSGCYPESSSANSAGHRTSSTPARSDPGGRADAAVGFDRETLQRPAWLFQGFSLNRT